MATKNTKNAKGSPLRGGCAADFTRWVFRVSAAHSPAKPMHPNGNTIPFFAPFVLFVANRFSASV
jgi:hypothetical protein